MERVRTACPLDCWDACGIIATVHEGRVEKLEGDPDHPITRGVLCARTYRYPERATHPARILSPMRNRDGRFVEITWDEALEEVATRLDALRTTGRTRAILHVQSSGSMGVCKNLSGRFWAALGGVTVADGDFCLGAGKEALTRHTGDYRAHDYDDARHARLIVLWGRDPLISGPHRMSFLQEARRRGARVVSVNPIDIARTPVVHETWKIRPGSDAWFAAGVARVLLEEDRFEGAFIARAAEAFDRFREVTMARDLAAWAGPTGLAPDDLRRFARMYANEAPAAILLGTGPIRYRGGVEAASWVSALPALMGYYGQEGGGVSFSVRHMRGVPPIETGAARRVPASTWHLDLDGLDPGIELLWVNGANPVTMMPESGAMARAFARIPFKVVVDIHWTDTARLADLVLPHPSFLEEDGLVTSWGHAYLAWQRAAIAPLGAARTDLAIFQELAARLGIGAVMAGSPAEWSARLMGERLNQDEWQELLMGKGHVRSRLHEPVPFRDGVFARANGRYLFPTAPPDLDTIPRGEPAYPFLLLTPKNRALHLSQTVDEPDQVKGTMGTAVAEHLGATGATQVHLRSRLGSVPAVLTLDPALQRDLVVVPFAGTLSRGTALNSLIGGACATDGVTAAYFDCPVAVDRG